MCICVICCDVLCIMSKYVHICCVFVYVHSMCVSVVVYHICVYVFACVCVCIFAALLLDVRACLYICCCLVCLHTLCMELLALLSIKYACAHVLLFSCLFTSMHQCMLLLCICRFVCWLRASDRPHEHSKGADHTGMGTSGGGHHWDRLKSVCLSPVGGPVCDSWKKSSNHCKWQSSHRSPLPELPLGACHQRPPSG